MAGAGLWAHLTSTDQTLCVIEEAITIKHLWSLSCPLQLDSFISIHSHLWEAGNITWSSPSALYYLKQVPACKELFSSKRSLLPPPWLAWKAGSKTLLLWNSLSSPHCCLQLVGFTVTSLWFFKVISGIQQPTWQPFEYSVCWRKKEEGISSLQSPTFWIQPKRTIACHLVAPHCYFPETHWSSSLVSEV